MLRLVLVPFQFALQFPDFGYYSLAGAIDIPSSLGIDLEHEMRTGLQWLKSVRAYCMWRAGDSWRKLNRSGERWKSSRAEYLDAARLITEILSTDHEVNPAQSALDAAAQADLDIMRGQAPIPLSLAEKQLSEKPRAALVDELMRDPLYTNRRLLEHLPKNKLARMVTQSRERRAADAAQERRTA